MNTTLESKKQELIKKIRESDDLNVIENILNFINEKSKDDFDEAFENGYTPEEARKLTTEFIRSLPWKK